MSLKFNKYYRKRKVELMMKRLILVLFIIFGTLSFSSLDKIIVGVVNDNYENPIISGTINRGGLANLLFGMKKDGDFARQMYQNLSDADKIEFIIEKHDESALISLLKIFEKRKYKGQMEITEVASSENKNIRQIAEKNKWTYNVYPFAREISGTVKISGNDMNKGEFVEGLFQDAKSKLK